MGSSGENKGLLFLFPSELVPLESTSWAFNVEQNFSTSTLLTFGLDISCRGYSVHCRVFSSILGLHPLNVSTTPSP